MSKKILIYAEVTRENYIHTVFFELAHKAQELAQKLNDAVKDAAKVAGLDRIITEVYYIGTERKEISYKFCDIISNHDARRTFVSCSLAMGIPAEVVMKFL